MVQNKTNEFESTAYKRSRWAYTFECAFEYFVSLLVAGAFLAKILTNIGMTDDLIGIVSSFISLAFLFQFFSVFVVQKISNTKRFVILFHSIGQLFFMALYLVPFLPFADGYRQIIACGCILLAYFGNYFVNSLVYRWGNSYVDNHKRASFSATKEMISLASGVIVSLSLGYIMDAFEAADNLHGAFIFSAIAILIFCICDFVCLMLIKNDIKPKTEKKNSIPMREVWKNTLGKKSFRYVIILTVLWNVCNYATIGFLGTYYLKELAFTVGTVQIITIVGHGGRFLLSKPLGRFSDRYSYSRGIALGMILAAASFLCVIAATPGTRLVIIGYTLFHSASLAGINQNMLNITYSFVEDKYFAQATAIKNSIGGICGFITALISGRIVAHIQANGNTVFGIPMYAQQFLGIISLLAIAGAFLFNHFVIQKQPMINRDKQ